MRFKPSTGPLETFPSAQNQFKMSALWLRSVLATFFIGSRFECIVRLIQASRNLSAHPIYRHCQNRAIILAHQITLSRNKAYARNLELCCLILIECDSPSCSLCLEQNREVLLYFSPFLTQRRRLFSSACPISSVSSQLSTI